jgi:hypothetical protein
MSTLIVMDANGIMNTNRHDKDYKICDAAGGLDVTRLVSTNARNFFRSAIEDVELMREYASEMAFAGNWTSEFASLEAMSRTLDWKARNFTNGTTTVDALIGYADDRPNRRIDRWAALNSTPAVGDPYTDFLLLDSLAALVPWIVDRKAKESAWWLDHQNGRSEGDGKDAFKFESLYTAGWTVRITSFRRGSVLSTLMGVWAPPDSWRYCWWRDYQHK